jgi:uncharacterized membrane protein
LKNKKTYHVPATISLLVLCSFYIVAGINHFIDPKVYYALIPPYFPNHSLLNILSGAFEIIAGILMIIPATRKFAVYLIIAILIAFIPAHIYLIQMKGCVSKKICVAEWIAWVRLFPLQFILMWWAWKTYKWTKK